ncbi:hypothetical protein PDR5_34240 [Pseudomonas sp. DR 5-09]|nr:hypothetical protein PDR5_34240 [Pseudomonas sp. DR 5-09]
MIHGSHSFCGSEPAREGGLSVNNDAEFNGPFAGKPAPTVLWDALKNGVFRVKHWRCQDTTR